MIKSNGKYSFWCALCPGVLTLAYFVATKDWIVSGMEANKNSDK